MEVAREHGTNEMTVRNWLERDTAAGASEILETSRLRRENEAPLRLVGQLTYEAEQQKKISAVLVAELASKSQLARELGISRASLYYRHKPPERDEVLRREIERVMERNPGYGSPRVALALKINAKRAARVMRKFGLKPARSSKTPRKC